MKENTFTGYGEVIKRYRQKAELSRAEVAEVLNITRNTLVNWEIERSQPDMRCIRELCSLLHIPLTELMQCSDENELSVEEKTLIRVFRSLTLTGKDIASKTLLAISEAEGDQRARNLRNNCTFLEFPTTPAAAGSGAPFGDDVPDLRFVRLSPKTEKADAIIRVAGRSMEPTYYSGDLVFVQYTEDVHPGDTVICSTADGAVIKRVSDDYKLHSINPAFPFGPKGEDDHVRVIGKVLGIADFSDFPSAEDIPLLEELFHSELQEYRMEHNMPLE